MSVSGLVDLDVFACPLSGVSLIEASAGTGKTWNICGLYLRLLLEHELPVERVLVVTFTKAATAELRERIRGRIVETLAQLDGRAASGDPFVPQLLAAVRSRQAIDDATLRSRLDLALQTFDEAAIYTIHGFCQRALADTPFAAGLPFKLDVSPDDRELIREAVADFWRREVAIDALPAPLAAWLLQRGDSPDAWADLLRRALARPLARVEWPDAPAEAPSPDAVSLAFDAARAAFTADPSPLASLEAARARGEINGNKVRADAPEKAHQAWQQWFEAVDPMLADVLLDGKDSPLRFFRASFLAEATKGGKAAPEHPFFDAADALIAARLAAEQALEYARLALIHRMLDAATDTLRTAKRGARVVAYDDMLANLHRALESGANPWLASALRDRYPAALIDEFQDTDPVQFAVFSRIYAGDNDVPAGPLFLVGDPKQAIYSFRNADLHTYLAARDAAQHRYTLRDNQRSSEPLIAAMNALFAANPGGFVLPGLNFETVALGAKRRPTFVDDTGEARGALQLWQLPPGIEGGAIVRKCAFERVAQACAGEIARLVGAGQRAAIRVDASPLQPSDIAVLVRSHKQAARMKAALAEVGVASVEISQTGVFQSTEASELARVLHAVREPARVGLLRAALATTLMGETASSLAVLDADEARLQAQVSRFAEWREQWNTRGISMMLRRWLSGGGASQGVVARLLANGNGERRLTNVLHLIELLQQASEEHPAPEALLRWLADQLKADTHDEVAQLRLESDRKLVQIVTIHKAKGLEYPITFTPFLWDGYRRPESRAAAVEYHDTSGRVVIDYRPEANDDETVKRARKTERAAEDVRLAYVALTRAVFRSYVVVGNYVTPAGKSVSSKESARSVLNWLAAGKGCALDVWDAGEAKPEAIADAWQLIAEASPEGISLNTLPDTDGDSALPPQPVSDRLAALPAPTQIPEGWKIGSFSRLAHGVHGAEQDHDALAAPRPLGPTPAAIAQDDILHFPRGASAGDCLHAVFERADFADPASWPEAARAALREHPQRTLEGGPRGQERLHGQILTLLRDVFSTPLRPGLRLSELPAKSRQPELGFHLPTGALNASRLNAWLAKRCYRMPPLTFQSLQGYLSGFIDLVFEHAGQYWVLDWKSNLLGFNATDYVGETLDAAMATHGYHLQYLLYTLALHRHLKVRLPHYDYDSHVGGTLYLFLRGVRPEWQADDGSPAGVYYRRPSRDDIESLDQLLGRGSNTDEAAA